jgi:hypothetical protein
LGITIVGFSKTVIIAVLFVLIGFEQLPTVTEFKLNEYDPGIDVGAATVTDELVPEVVTV